VHYLATIDNMARECRTLIPLQVLADIDDARNPMQLTRERLERTATENQFMNEKIAAMDVSACFFYCWSPVLMPPSIMIVVSTTLGPSTGAELSGAGLLSPTAGVPCRPYYQCNPVPRTSMGLANDSRFHGSNVMPAGAFTPPFLLALYPYSLGTQVYLVSECLLVIFSAS
jgi:Transcription factor subunit Med10 of Mediator complex